MLRILVLLIASSSLAQDSLKLHYTSQVELSQEQLELLSNDNINNSSALDDYTLALSYYYKAIVEGNKKRFVSEFAHYDNALKFLLKSDTTDNYLLSSIYKNQGWIAKKHLGYELAIEKYKLALDPAINYDKVLSSMTPEQLEKQIGKEYYYDRSRELGIRFNLGLALKYIDIGKALEEFDYLLNESRRLEYSSYIASSYRQLGNISREVERFEEAEMYYKEILDLNCKLSYKAWAYHELSKIYFEKEDYKAQEDMLNKALSLNQESNRFTSMVNLGESLMKQGRRDEALTVLLDAEKFYDDQASDSENFLIFKLIKELDHQPLKYSDRWGTEWMEFAREQEKLKQEAKRLSFLNSVANLERQKELQKSRQFWTMWISILVGAVLLTWLGIVLYRRYQKKTAKGRYEEIFE